MSVLDINHRVLIAFVVLFDTVYFKARSIFLALPVQHFLEWVESATVPAPKEIIERMELEFSRRKTALKESQIHTSRKLDLHKLGTEYIFQVLRASLAVHTNVMMDCRIRELFFAVFCYRTFPVTLLNGARFLQLVFNNTQAKANMPYEISMPTAFEVFFYFHSILFMRREVGKNKLNFN